MARILCHGLKLTLKEAEPLCSYMPIEANWWWESHKIECDKQR